ncbi:GP5 [Lopma virus]|nr:GP5 [Lopma virus]
MTCSKSWAPCSMRFVSLLSVLVFCTIYTTEASNTTLATIYNLTLCQFNVTDVSNHFDYVIEGALIYPLVTHAISHYFLTTAYFLDFAPLAAISIAAIYQKLYVLGAIHAFMAIVALILLCRRVILNILALRYACTRHTNFILDTKGSVHLNKSPVLISDQFGVRLNNAHIQPKIVVFDGIKAHPVNTSQAEEWAA